ncbi:type II toxin-antitoxin system MqsA family antitoxin [Sulfuriferula thiophila]|uniref:type II toxin-antitoxin system MqsA family antitoxin n=1 Tax=Sulfuriferula thiophila TaxID=1781211 RepID=UPI001678A005|nr:type II toxin-antitoxin system MqsA family antitoxin [Sulfuriferula thiophila]
MVSNWNGKPCPLCGAGTLHDGIKTITQEYKGRIFSSETRGAFCDHCADGFVEFDAAEEAKWLTFRDQVDAAEAAELARIRKKLRLTQAQAAHLTGGGKNAFSRYERGNAKPVAAVVNLFRLLDHHPELLKELVNNKSV